MCLILFAYDVHPIYRWVLAANRDEFYDRPTASADFWSDHPNVLAGRDLQENGSWLGVTKAGKIAAVTNFRDPSSSKTAAPSRGQLVSGFLTGNESAESYIEKLSPRADAYNGFNLLVGDETGLWVFSNHDRAVRLKPGVYGLSNHLLDTPWPKIRRGKKALTAVLDQTGDALEASLFQLLSDRHRPADRDLPQTGVGLEWERMLSPMFIQTPVYGTRSSTVLLFARNGRIRFVEKNHNGGEDPWMTGRFSFVRKKE